MMDTLPIEKRLLSTMETLAVTESPDFLVRSRSEVQRVLSGMLEKRSPVSVYIVGTDQVVASELLHVDEGQGALMFSCPSAWRTHIEAPDGKNVMLVCSDEQSKIQFQGGQGAIAEFNGRPVARIGAPTFIWRFQRRGDLRYAVPSLKIVLNLGFLESEAEVADLSLGGTGVVNCDTDVNLDEGELLKDCSIALPGVGKITVDLTVEHQSALRMVDGASMNRVGCRFSGLSEESRTLILHYLGTVAAE